MSDKFDNENEEQGPEELVIRAFSRCSNYPKERAGVLGMEQCLKAASDRFGVPMTAILAECVEQSSFCPTDHDLLETARRLMPAAKTERRTKCPHAICDGSGWTEEFWLHTVHAGDEKKGQWVEKRMIESREVFEDLERKVDWKTQKVFSGRRRCLCHPPRAEDMEDTKPRRRAVNLQRAATGSMPS